MLYHNAALAHTTKLIERCGAELSNVGLSLLRTAQGEGAPQATVPHSVEDQTIVLVSDCDLRLCKNRDFFLCDLEGIFMAKRISLWAHCVLLVKW